MSSMSTQSEGTAIELGPSPQPDHDIRPGVTQGEGIPHSRDTLFKLASAGLSFFCAGLNDGSLGALIPYILRSYSIGTDLVSAVYGTTFTGWLLTALINTHLCQYLDLGVLLALGAALQLLAQVLRCWLPPFPLFAITFFVQSLGMALQDTHSNTWVTSVKLAHRWLGFIHAMYALGLWVGPLVATAVASSDDGSKWYLYYTCLVGFGTINLALVLLAFKDKIKLKPASSQTAVSPEDESIGTRKASALIEIQQTLRLPAVWLLSLYFFFFLGALITASGWVVEYLITVRDGEISKMGYVQTGFAGGMFLGRVLLAEPTKRLGERRMVFVYATLCLGLELVFWLVPNIIAGAVAISIFGFFSGPFFATGVSIGSQIFPASIRSSALACVFMLGQVGGAVFPAFIGLIASRVGVKALQPMLVGLCSATGVVWLLVPKPNLHRE